MRVPVLILPVALVMACAIKTTPDDDTGGDGTGEEGGEEGGGEEGGGDGNINIKPEVLSVAISPEDPTTGDELTCSAEASDEDGDELNIRYAWTVDEVEAGTEATLAAGSARGSEVVCEAVAYDGSEASDPLTATAIIGNSPPTVDSVSISPEDPTVEHELVCEAEGSDADGDEVSFSWAWTINGAAAGSSDRISGDHLKADQVVCEVTPLDAADVGAADSASVTIGNVAPGAPTVDATDDPVVGSDDIVCEITAESTDADVADTLSYVVEWEADGSVYPDDFGSAVGPDTTTHTDDTVPAADTALAADWTCTVYATDGTDSSATASDTATVVQESASLDTGRSGITYAATGSFTTNAPNYLVAQAYTAGSDQTVTGFGVSWAFGYCTECDFAIYTDSSGPDALEGSMSTSACGTTSGGTNEISGTSFSVAAGDLWLASAFATCSYGSTYYIADDGGSGITTYYETHTMGSMSDPSTLSSTVSSRLYGIYPIGY